MRPGGIEKSVVAATTAKRKGQPAVKPQAKFLDSRPFNYAHFGKLSTGTSTSSVQAGIVLSFELGDGTKENVVVPTTAKRKGQPAVKPQAKYLDSRLHGNDNEQYMSDILFGDRCLDTDKRP